MGTKQSGDLLQVAGRDGVDPMVVDLDYVLGCFLAALYRAEAPPLRFKGGTCLRKCWRRRCGP